MEERLQIVQSMEKLAGRIKTMEEEFDSIKSIDIKFFCSIQVRYVIPIDYKYPYGEARAVCKESKAQFTVPDELKEKTFDSIRQLYEESLKRYYQLLSEYAEKLGNVL